jgi:hypothetical protein
VFDGTTGSEVRGFFAFDPTFRGGVSVAAGRADSSGPAHLVVGAGPGGGPHVMVFDPLTWTATRSFYAFDPGFAGGVNVAVPAAVAEGLYVGMASLGSTVKHFSGPDWTETDSFTAYPGAGVGVRVASADFDARSDIAWPAHLVTGAGPGGGPHVGLFARLPLIPPPPATPYRSFFAFDPGMTGGVSVAAAAEHVTARFVGVPAPPPQPVPDTDLIP